MVVPLEQNGEGGAFEVINPVEFANYDTDEVSAVSIELADGRTVTFSELRAVRERTAYEDVLVFGERDLSGHSATDHRNSEKSEIFSGGES